MSYYETSLPHFREGNKKTTLFTSIKLFKLYKLYKLYELYKLIILKPET